MKIINSNFSYAEGVEPDFVSKTKIRFPWFCLTFLIRIGATKTQSNDKGTCLVKSKVVIEHERENATNEARSSFLTKQIDRQINIFVLWKPCAWTRNLAVKHTVYLAHFVMAIITCPMSVNCIWTWDKSAGTTDTESLHRFCWARSNTQKHTSTHTINQ